MLDLIQAYPFFNDKKIISFDLLQDQGYCNENYLLQTDKSKYIVRKLVRDDIDRVIEWKVLHQVYSQGLTAEPILYDDENDIMIFEYLEGQHKYKLMKEEVDLLAQTLKKLHSIKIEGQQPMAIEIQQMKDDLVDALKIIEHYPKEYVLCHNDLNPKNVFFSKEVKFIDFEYAGVNDRYFDLACISVEFKLNSEMEKVLLSSYFEGKTYILKKLQAYKTVYQVLCEEWFERLQ
jgi:thiamine kinase-like enzyme